MHEKIVFLRKTMMSCLLILLTLTSAVSQAAGAATTKHPAKKTLLQNLNSNALPTASKANNNKGKKSVSSSTIYQWGMGEAVNKSESELVGMVKSVDVLIKDKAVGNQRFNLMLSQVSNYLALARLYRIRTPQSEKDRKNELICLTRANNISEMVIKSGQQDAKYKARALYFRGVAQVYMNKSDEARATFKESIKLDSNSEHVTTMSLFMAEHSFDREKFKEAIDEYRQFFNRFNKEQKAMAVYKMAWCYFRLQDYTQAEDLMVKLLLTKATNSFAKDALEDLAQFTSKTHTENELVDFAATRFYSDKKIQYDYLMNVYLLLRSSTGTRHYPIIYNELMRLEARPEQKLQLMVKNLRFEQRQYASRAPLQSMREIMSFLERNNISTDSEVFKTSSEPLETEVLSLVHTYAETYSKKIKSPENLSVDEMTKVLRGLIDFHFKYFPNSKNKKVTTTVLVGLCHESKDYECVYRLSKKIIEDKQLSDLHVNAKKDYLFALDRIYKTTPALKEEYMGTVTKFLQENPQDKDWMKLAKKLSAIYNEERKFNSSIPILQSIYDREKNTENFHRLKMAYFESGLYADVVKEPISKPKDEFGKKTLELYRQSYLNLAKNNADKGDLANYEVNVRAYLATGPDEKDADAVRLDFLKKLADKKLFEALLREYNINVNPKKWMDAKYRPTTNKMINNFIKEGNFGALYDFLNKGSTFGKISDIDVYWFTAILGKPRAMTETEKKYLNEMKKDVRNYFLGILALTQPRLAQDFLKKYKPKYQTEIKDDQKMMLLALRMEQGRAEINIGPEMVKFLGKSVPQEVLDKEEAPIEKKMKKIEFPGVTASGATIERMTPAIVNQVQSLRKTVVKEIQNKSVSAQTRILRMAMSLELKTADLIQSSPIPAELKEEAKVTEYKKQVDEIAGGFSDQAKQYQKIIDGLVENKTKGQDVFANPDLESLPKLPDAEEKIFTRFMADGNYTGAILFVDKLKTDEAITEELYYSSRARTLLRSNSGDYTVSYIHSELQNAKQERLIQLFHQSSAAQLNSSGANGNGAGDAQQGQSGTSENKDKTDDLTLGPSEIKKDEKSEGKNDKKE